MTEKKESHSNYKGFVAGVFSGIAKLSGMFNTHPRPPDQGWDVSQTRFKLDKKLADMQEGTDMANSSKSWASIRYNKGSPADLRLKTLLRSPSMSPTNGTERGCSGTIQRSYSSTCRMDVYGQHYARVPHVLPPNPPPNPI
jgi:hypothetical protein